MEFHERLRQKMLALIEEGRIGLSHVLDTPRREPIVATVLEIEAANARDPAEAIHDLRVALRRLRSVLRPMQIVYGKRTLTTLEDRLAGILNLTSDLRDEEVLRETLTGLALSDQTKRDLERWMVGRARRERGLRARATRALSVRQGEESQVEESSKDTDVVRCLDDLTRAVERGPKHVISRTNFQRSGLERALEGLEKRARASHIADVASMHRVRIGAKRLRYVAELLGELHEAPPSNELSAEKAEETDASAPSKNGGGSKPVGEHSDLIRIGKSSARIQKRLGQLHDFDEALSRMSRAWGLDKAPRADVLKALASARHTVGEKSSAELSDELGRIRAAATRVLEEPPARQSTVAFARVREPDEDATG